MYYRDTFQALKPHFLQAEEIPPIQASHIQLTMNDDKWYRSFKKYGNTNAKIYSDFHVHIPGGGRRLYTSDLNAAPTFIQAHVPLRNQCLYPDRKEIGVKCLQQRGDSLLHVTDLQIAGQPGAS
jgi:hypothetical protein